MTKAMLTLQKSVVKACNTSTSQRVFLFFHVPKTALESQDFVGHRSALSAGRATASQKLRNSSVVGFLRCLGPAVAGAPAQTLGVSIPSIGVKYLLQHVVSLFRSVRHLVKHLLLLADDVLLLLFKLHGDAILPPLVADAQFRYFHSRLAAYELPCPPVMLNALTDFSPAVVHS